MSTIDYERLLTELTEARAETAGTVDTAWKETADRIERLEDRLLVQQAELLKLATTLHFKAPPLRPTPEDIGTAREPESACRSCEREADSADAAAQRALSLARMPSFLPNQRPLVRHLTIYLLCALGAVAVECLAVASQGFVKASWIFAAAPLAAFAVGYVVIGSVGRPRVLPESKRARRALLPTRDPKPGLMLCLIASVVTAAAFLLS
ncbi:hypothetical protein [Stackebrandtia nassauensis]|uniref:Uncharacterized protein n=1 Tax=Stackebrandtia nassauensis (strain DSM 44728 / CIP 108903 / NRRL B-16338 / NBRC 102104 / LLR-40K-21) TaxID=446470 RepID=D3QAX8_STANL|nr:hypothetical protein [Stackebrandtia nassauensis]ADD44774.1 hypothetical protein Snas_5139 [Stackebrandtia nassauensis DSM 44728]